MYIYICVCVCMSASDCECASVCVCLCVPLYVLCAYVSMIYYSESKHNSITRVRTRSQRFQSPAD